MYIWFNCINLNRRNLWFGNALERSKFVFIWIILYSDVCLKCTPNFVLTTHIYFLIKVSTYDLQSYKILSLRDRGSINFFTSTSRFNALKQIDHLCNRNGFCMQRHLPDAVFISCLLLLGVDGSQRFRIHPRICIS